MAKSPESPKSQWLKLYVEFNAFKRVETEKNGSKDGKVLYKLMNNVVTVEQWKT